MYEKSTKEIRKLSGLTREQAREIADAFWKVFNAPSLSRQILRPRPVKKGRKKS
jgi:hypothetical protein